MEPTTIGLVGGSLMVIGILGGWSWRVARWLIDIKDGIRAIDERLEKVDIRQSRLETSVNQLWEVAGWVRSKLGEPMPDRRE